MTIIDISWPLCPKTTEYKNKGTIFFKSLKEFEQDGVRDSKICLGTHTGTHVDAPAHFLKDGVSIEQVPLTSLIGPALVVDIPDGVDAITVYHLQQAPIQENHIVLLRTRNSMCAPDARFNPEFVYLNADAAQYLADKKVKAVGIDYLGIERGDPEHTTHTVLLSRNIPIIEGLRLGHVQSGKYFFICLPLALHGLEAAPARAILTDY